MGENSKIEWCDHTFNPWIGCSKVSAGCANCYAEADFDHRKHFAKWGPGGTRVITGEATWRGPIRWNRAAAAGREVECSTGRPRVFCASLADVFEDFEGDEKDGTPRAVRDCKGNRLATRSGYETAIQWPVEAGWRPLV